MSTDVIVPPPLGPGVDSSGAQEMPPDLPELRKSDLDKSFWRFFSSFEVSWNYERMQALGYAYAMEPVLRRLYPDKAAYSAALQRHLVFFNTSVIVGAPLILGSSIALEEAGAPASAEGIKVGLMGPMAGIGDTLTYALYNSIIFTICASFALQGNIIGPIMPLFLCASRTSLSGVGSSILPTTGAVP